MLKMPRYSNNFLQVIDNQHICLFTIHNIPVGQKNSCHFFGLFPLRNISVIFPTSVYSIYIYQDKFYGHVRTLNMIDEVLKIFETLSILTN